MQGKSSSVTQYNLFAHILGCSDLGITDSNIKIFDPSTGNIVPNIPQTFNSSVYITCVDGYYLSAEEFGQCKYSWNVLWLTYPIRCRIYISTSDNVKV